MQNKPKTQFLKCRRCGGEFTLSPATPSNQITQNLCPTCIADMLLEQYKNAQSD